MSWETWALIVLPCALTILIFRVLPVFALKGRTLPAGAVRTLNLIPAAAFAALIANDLLSPTMFAAGFWEGIMPLIAAAIVFAVGYKTKSLIWCIVAGVGGYALLTLI